MALNITQIPAARVPLVDTDTGLVNRDWYRFLSNLYKLAGQGSNAISLDDMQVSPPTEYRDEDDLSAVPDNPSASVGLATVNGSAATFMRSDAAPPLSQGISPTWTATHVFSAGIKLTPATVAGLPAAATAGAGARSHVSDALAPVFGANVAGGGAVNIPVYSDGANWKVG